MLGLYVTKRGKNRIALDEEALSCTRRNAAMSKAALDGPVAGHLEADSPSTRHAATMVNLSKGYKVITGLGGPLG